MLAKAYLASNSSEKYRRKVVSNFRKAAVGFAPSYFSQKLQYFPRSNPTSSLEFLERILKSKVIIQPAHRAQLEERLEFMRFFHRQSPAEIAEQEKTKAVAYRLEINMMRSLSIDLIGLETSPTDWQPHLKWLDTLYEKGPSAWAEKAEALRTGELSGKRNPVQALNWLKSLESHDALATPILLKLFKWAHEEAFQQEIKLSESSIWGAQDLALAASKSVIEKYNEGALHLTALTRCVLENEPEADITSIALYYIRKNMQSKNEPEHSKMLPELLAQYGGSETAMLKNAKDVIIAADRYYSDPAEPLSWLDFMNYVSSFMQNSQPLGETCSDAVNTAYKIAANLGDAA
ncbi:MAG: hypothetical protein JKY60_19320 [Kordiimonadaceae bacterium]|nr:hypothetical protein [Kordiimonadaceae bacterium]